MSSCSAYGCSFRSTRKGKMQIEYENKGGEKIRFYRFPSNPVMKKQWVNSVRRVGWQPSKVSRLCSRHFTDECFERYATQVRLLPGAVPTVFPSHIVVLPVKPKPKNPTSAREPSDSALRVFPEKNTSVPEPTNPAFQASPGKNTAVPEHAAPALLILKASPSRAKLNSTIVTAKQDKRKQMKILQQRVRRSEKKIAKLKAAIGNLTAERL